jgi:hypothetical protein
MSMAQPLPTVRQMQTHCRPRRIRILARNRVVNLFVLTAQATHALLIVMGYARGPARNDPWSQLSFLTVANIKSI